MTKPKAGRPPKALRDRRSIVIEVRLSEDEKEAFRLASGFSGITASAWIRERLRQAAASELERAGIAIPFYRNRSA